MSEEQQRSKEQQRGREHGSDDGLDDETFERVSREKRLQPASDDLPSEQGIGKD